MLGPAKRFPQPSQFLHLLGDSILGAGMECHRQVLIRSFWIVVITIFANIHR